MNAHARVREGEAERKRVVACGRVVAVLVLDKGGETLGAEIKELLAVVLLLLFTELVLGLGDFELAVALEGHGADSEVGAAWRG